MAGLNDQLADVAAALNHSTVEVQSHRFGGGSGVIWQTLSSPTPLPGGTPYVPSPGRGGLGRGSLIITNAHVIRGSQAQVKLSDKRVLDAVCIKRDIQQDLAALRVDATDLPAATIGDSDAIRVGELVQAVGNPLGFVGAVTTGIIHAIAPPPRKWVQADIRLAPGNSGGALADAQGRVIGINTVIAGGLALAVPSNTVKRFLLRSEQPLLGVTLQPVIIPLRAKRVLGLLILEVSPGSLAASAGLLTGDVLIGTNGRFFKRTTDLAQAWQISDTLQLEFIRGGKCMTCLVHQPGETGAEAA